ncbi:tetratricopeptide repeat protein [Criblamydia sequanensis]|uniref:Uncharacterized protein n=1 Tax=Candidatus Criblamydia sequanensis CRIB-18 TaxID=1437425 RepID=A0A090DV49_9BACT|nr:hypothetical protein [Criblamydia sequanensis]CDR32889.1 hypothetical protein CSEC_0045 [Criblamydia sequanensis CRIB-18]
MFLRIVLIILFIIISENKVDSAPSTLEPRKNYELALTRSDDLFREGNYTDSLLILENLKESQYKNETYLKLASFHLFLNNPYEAKLNLKEIKDQDPSAAYLFALALKMEGEKEEARKLLANFFSNKLPENEIEFKASFEWAHLLIENQEYQKALKPLFYILDCSQDQKLKEAVFFMLAAIHIENQDFIDNEEDRNKLFSQAYGGDLFKKIQTALSDEFLNFMEFENNLTAFKRSIDAETTNPLLKSALILYDKLCLKGAEMPFSEKTRQSLIDELKINFFKRGAHSENEIIYLAKAFVIEGVLKRSKSSIQSAKSLLRAPNLIISHHNRREADILEALASNSLEERSLSLTRLIESEKSRTDLIKLWFYKGYNDYQKGLYDGEEASQTKSLESSKEAFLMCLKLSENDNIKKDPLKILESAYSYLLAISLYDPSFEALDLITSSKKACSQNLMDNLNCFEQIKTHLKEGLSLDLKTIIEKNPHAEDFCFLLGLSWIKNKNYEKALEVFSLPFKETNKKVRAEYLCAICEQKLGNEKLSLARFKDFRERYPNHELSEKASFYSFSLQDYLMGEKEAVKHLKLFPEKYSDSPLCIIAYYLLGKDSTKDRKSKDNNWIKRKNLAKALDYYNLAEQKFEALSQKSPSISKEYECINYQAGLSKALLQKRIASNSKGTKKQIFIQYAYEELEKLLDFVSKRKDPYFEKARTEVQYYLSELHKLSGETKKAKEILFTLISQNKKEEADHFISKSYWKLAELALEDNNPKEALDLFEKSEECNVMKWLARSEKQLFLISKSLSLKEMGKLDEAMFHLSLAVNEDSLSKLRLKAMFHRAEIYTLQKRDELSIQQLKAIMKHEGEWSKKAKSYMEKYYGTAVNQ